MNGDGITDIVRLKRGDIHYWPGRGNGYWGTGDLNCPEGTFDQNGDLAMADSPYYTDIQGTSLRLDDVNGDGLSDLIQVNFTDVSVWLNVNGTDWTTRYIINNTPASPAYANRVRLADVNGSGTPDILWGDGNSYKYIDLAGGVRPWLLKKVSNGLGKTTEIEYKSSAQEMLDAKNAGPDKAWTSKMPTLTQVVKRVTEKDNLTIAGRPPATYVTEYTYRDPVFEGRQREFRGFREAEARKIGDANSPTSITRNVFLLGECRDETANGVDDCSNPERWRDNPREALKGLPIISETRDERGIYVSTTHNKYTLRHLYDGLDGRAVRQAFLSETNKYLYDTARFVPSGLDPTAQTVAKVEKLNGSQFSSDGFTALDEKAALPIQSVAGMAHIRSAVQIDAFGNLTRRINSGVVGQDEEIVATSVPLLQSDNASNWLWRTARSFTVGSEHTQEVLNDLRYSYDVNGDLTFTHAVLQGTLSLDREIDDSTTTHPHRSSDSVIELAENHYDQFGNLEQANGAGQRRSFVVRDEQYKQLPISETIYAGRQSLSSLGGESDGSNPLTTTARYDRGLGVLIAAIEPNQQPTKVIYDSFGRLIKLYKADPRAPAEDPVLSPRPSARIEYFLPPQSGSSYSLVHTETQDSAQIAGDSYLENWSYIDGYGRPIATLYEAEPEPGGVQSAQRWIVSGLSETDQKHAQRRKYLEFFYQGDPREFNFAQQPGGPYGRQRYDAFGRQLQTFDLDGTVTLLSVYHALSTDLWDAADLEPGGMHAGSFASETRNGHGRTIETAERFRVEGAMETRYTRTQYLPTGEPEVIRRVRSSTSEVTSRWFVYDSLGRMVLNVEPHSSVEYALNGSPNQDFDDYATDYAPGTVTAWRYAYNDAGDLVGTSDARGCGTNYFYDAAGRLTGEDYFPCDGALPDQPDYSEPILGVSPNSLSGDGLEVFYEYDTAVLNSGCSVAQNNVKGRLSRVRDQARATLTSYDARGRTSLTAVRIAKPGPVEETLDERYTGRCYRKDFDYDAADRPLEETTGAQQLMGAVGESGVPESAVSYEYSRRGSIAKVKSSYGGPDPAQAGQGSSSNLVSEIVRTADNRVEKIEYGDLARTATTYTYDDRRRVQSVVTSRAAPSIWPEGEIQSPNTFQLLLQDEEYSYDVVNNPTEIRDWRIPSEWDPGAKPVTKKIDYDDLYRVSRLSYEYAAGDDTWQSPYDAENQSSNDDARRAKPSPHVSFAKRILWQSYRYDWLGNQSKTDDDAKGFYDRSLGTVVNGEEDGSEDNVPYQLKSATQTGPNGGNLKTRYDAAGNLTRLLVDRQGYCLPDTPAPQASCDQWFEYTWDEVGRLSRARRWDGLNLATVNVTTAPIPGDTPAADLSYHYDASHNRVRKTASDGVTERHTIYIFSSLELRGSIFDGPDAEDYELSNSTEVVYLFANGVRLARAHFESMMDPGIGTSTVGQGQLRVFFELGDHLGSTSVVLDKATSELVERSTFQGYGGNESDYRPERWKNFREDYRFTGKEDDVEVGLQYFGNRYLNPLLGRWISPDPLTVHALGADANVYAYAQGRALQAIDPLGMDAGPIDDGGIITDEIVQASEDMWDAKQASGAFDGSGEAVFGDYAGLGETSASESLGSGYDSFDIDAAAAGRAATRAAATVTVNEDGTRTYSDFWHWQHSTYVNANTEYQMKWNQEPAQAEFRALYSESREMQWKKYPNHNVVSVGAERKYSVDVAKRKNPDRPLMHASGLAHDFTFQKGFGSPHPDDAQKGFVPIEQLGDPEYAPILDDMAQIAKEHGIEARSAGGSHWEHYDYLGGQPYTIQLERDTLRGINPITKQPSTWARDHGVPDKLSSEEKNICDL
jgi:RHS repeat-associated protein